MREKGEGLRSSWSRLNYELVCHHCFAILAQARTASFDYIEAFYNRTRLHSGFAYLTPITLNPN
jgi:putative transposase